MQHTRTPLQRQSNGFLRYLLLLASCLQLTCLAQATVTEITIRGAVLHAPPFATVEWQTDGSFLYGGIQADMLERLKIFAREDGIDLNFELSPSPSQYGASFDLVANDCNTSAVPNPLEECEKYDMIVANFYATPERSLRADLSPAWLRSTISTIKYLDKKNSTDFTTMEQVSEAHATVCLKDGTFYAGQVRKRFPETQYLNCDNQDVCLNYLKSEKCVLYASDELQLRFRAANDISLEVTPESFNTQYIAWAFKDNTPNVRYVKKWVYKAIINTTMDELYFKYFQKELCPVGTAGESCELPCDPDHGEADQRGLCVCRSRKWTGPACDIEVMEEYNLIPQSLKTMAYLMVGINIATSLSFAAWLVWKRETTQVRIGQPFFLALILLGCLFSTLSIVALAQEDGGAENSEPNCMTIPWLYSVGFSITFGTLFAKIRRVYFIFKSAADMRRKQVTFAETIAVMGAVLVIDVVILTVWTLVDPLEWRRTVVDEDKFGEPLESEGFCTSDTWEIWVAIIAILHLFLLGVACYLCYVSRDIPTKFSEGKYVSIAMFSNLQIFVVGVPILLILGSDPEASFFVRTVIIWMNDFVVISLIFGNLIYHVHFYNPGAREDANATIGTAIQKFSTAQKTRSSRILSRKSSNNVRSSRFSLSDVDEEGSQRYSVEFATAKTSTPSHSATSAKGISKTSWAGLEYMEDSTASSILQGSVQELKPELEAVGEDDENEGEEDHGVPSEVGRSVSLSDDTLGLTESPPVSDGDQPQEGRVADGKAT